MSRTSKRKAKQKRNLVLAAILAVILVGGGAYCYFTYFNKPAPEVITEKTYTEKEVFPGQDERDGKDTLVKKDEAKENSDSTSDEPEENSHEDDGDGGVSDAKLEGSLEVHFIDVGQGDASLIIFRDTNPDNGDDSAAMLVDAGDESKGTLVRNYINKQWSGDLSYFVCSHPDADHIGGAASVVSNINITSEKVFAPDFKKDTKTYENLLNEISYKNYSYEMPELFTEYSLGLATFEFFAPAHEHSDTNNSSLVMKIWYGDESFLFTGDCGEEEEQELANGSAASLLSADVLKVGHHGSKTSTSADFLNLVSPEYAVISCGEGNSYGHPHAAALNNLREKGVSLFRTDDQGSIVAKTDEFGISWNATPCDNWTSGGDE